MPEQVIFDTLSGSHVYGTNIPSSDLDYKGIIVPDAKDILLQTTPRTTNIKSNKAEGIRNGPEDCDREYFALHYFMKLLMDGQTHPIEMLFIPERFWRRSSIAWENIRRNRDKLLSKKLKAFVGYAKNQAHKYSMKGERLATVEAYVKFLRDANSSQTLLFYYAALARLIEVYPKHSKIVDIENNDRVLPHLEVCGRKIDLNASVEYALNCYEWVMKEYGDRAKASIDGVDWKAVMHAVRVAEEAVELLQTGFITFPRPNALYLLGLRTGKFGYDDVMDHFERTVEQIESIAPASTLPDEPDYETGKQLVLQYYNEMVVYNEVWKG
jgi:predicted nucleotidyltransferase